MMAHILYVKLSMTIGFIYVSGLMMVNSNLHDIASLFAAENVLIEHLAIHKT